MKIIHYLSLSLLMLSPIVQAKTTTWIAGTRFKGQVTVPMKNQSSLFWKCNGTICRVSGKFGESLSLEACQGLVKHTGPLRFYKNNKGQIWSYKSKQLAECNNVARIKQDIRKSK